MCGTCKPGRQKAGGAPAICRAAADVLRVRKQRWPGNIPLVGGKEQDVGTGGVHLVGLPGMDGLLLHSLNLQGI